MFVSSEALGTGSLPDNARSAVEPVDREFSALTIRYRAVNTLDPLTSRHLHDLPHELPLLISVVLIRH